jgi:hypothetical protein
MTLSIATLGIMNLSIATLSIMPFSTTPFGILTLSIMTMDKMTLSRMCTQHNDASITTLRITILGINCKKSSPEYPIQPIILSVVMLSEMAPLKHAEEL